ncbi:acyltransferase family protein [Lysobacter gummosus]|uniref:acyltransferase family protein n=1 Tax=Lysobacter gummosus TaxID=262324 RepID=UPI003631EFCD
MPQQGKNLDFVQALRGAAALAVVLYHGSRFISPYGEGLGYKLFGSGGSMGVDLFFVISGFIMAYTTTDSDGSSRYVAKFAIKRWARIWPTYVLLSLVYVVVTWGWGWIPENLGAAFVSLTFIPLISNTPVAIQYPSLSVGWSLNYEMYFYLFFGVSMLFGRWRWLAFFSWIAFSLLVIPMLVGAPPTLSTRHLYPDLPGVLQMAANPIVWLFAGGVVICHIYRSPFKLQAFWAAAVVLLGCTAWGFQFASGFRAEHGLSFGGFSAILLVLALTTASKTIELKAPNFLVALGNISFSLYLLHPLVQEQTEAAFHRLGQHYFAKGFPMLFLTTAISVVLALVSHNYLERQFSDWVKERLIACLTRFRPATAKIPTTA